MKHIPLKQVHYEGITIQIPEIWEAATEKSTEDRAEAHHLHKRRSCKTDIQLSGGSYRSHYIHGQERRHILLYSKELSWRKRTEHNGLQRNNQFKAEAGNGHQDS